MAMQDQIVGSKTRVVSQGDILVEAQFATAAPAINTTMAVVPPAPRAGGWFEQSNTGEGKISVGSLGEVEPLETARWEERAGSWVRMQSASGSAPYKIHAADVRIDPKDLKGGRAKVSIDTGAQLRTLTLGNLPEGAEAYISRIGSFSINVTSDAGHTVNGKAIEEHNREGLVILQRVGNNWLPVVTVDANGTPSSNAGIGKAGAGLRLDDDTFALDIGTLTIAP